MALFIIVYVHGRSFEVLGIVITLELKWGITNVHMFVVGSRYLHTLSYDNKISSTV